MRKEKNRLTYNFHNQTVYDKDNKSKKIYFKAIKRI